MDVFGCLLKKISERGFILGFNFQGGREKKTNLQKNKLIGRVRNVEELVWCWPGGKYCSHHIFWTPFKCLL